MTRGVISSMDQDSVRRRHAPRRHNGRLGAVALALCIGGASAAQGQELKFQFTNPSFGGNPFNSGHLLGLADIQNQYEAPSSGSSARGNSQTDLFVRQLQSRLLSSLSSSLAEAITGAEPGTSDTITLDEQQIFYERTVDSVRVEITNLLDGSSTEIVIPVLQTGS